MPKYEAKFTFSTIDYPESTKLCFNNLAPFKECDCCWAMYMPSDLEYNYTEYLAEYNINYEKKDYINIQHRKDEKIVYFQNEIQFLKDYDYTKISDEEQSHSVDISDSTYKMTAKYKTLREMYMDIACRIINSMEIQMYDLNRWYLHNNFINILRKPKYNSSDKLFEFSNHGKEVLTIKIAKIAKITTV